MSTQSAPTRIHDVVGIGIGPFNLGLAALSEPLGIDVLFLDRADEFRWHHGMMLEGSRRSRCRSSPTSSRWPIRRPASRS